MLVREATVEDGEAFLAALDEAAGEGWIITEPGFDREGRRESFEEAVTGSGPDRVLVLEDDGQVVGAGGLHSTGAEGVLSIGMAILSGGRGRGGGRLLLEGLIAAAGETGAHKLVLEVWPDNGRAIALYEDMGFETEGVLRDHYRRQDGSLRSAVLMAMWLPGPGAEA
jgi:putative acetyltransferase